MNLDCSILLEDKQRFKSGGVMCVDFIYFYACFDAHLHTLSMLDLCIFVLPAFLLAYLLFLFGDLLFVHFLYTRVKFGEDSTFLDKTYEQSKREGTWSCTRHDPALVGSSGHLEFRGRVAATAKEEGLAV